MRSLFEASHYRNFLEQLVYGKDIPRGTQVRMAKAMGCQATYLSQVIKGKAELTEDHAVKLATFLDLSETAAEYLILLIRHARAGTPELRHHLEKQRTKILESFNDSKTRIRSENKKFTDQDLQRYFSSWVPSTVHAATSSENFQSIERIAKRLHLTPEKVSETLTFLASLGLVSEAGKRWKFASGSIHFPKDSSINETHQLARRAQALQSIAGGDKSALHFSSIFTLDKPTFLAIKRDLLDYIESSHKKIQASGTDEIYSLCLDLFRV